ncbi:MAG TPA: asparagine synthase (glutamine-hydrolyzing) [Thermoanaerobaculia bacterium]|nr:asparagine synthase (glutamine-hydrolyzing) [Thermoanaerobaculia bacterium]
MCGIAGWVDSGGIDPAAMDRALEALNRRGPDGSGAWTNSQRTVILGHRRLAILDPSVRGEEPSVAPDRRSAFIHNGEVYNFRELRRDLESRGESFVSESDGEVVHRLLRLEGAAGLERVEGMFALAMWNEPSRTLLLARDRIGIKPLYYASWPGGFAFASEPKAILRLPGISARLDPDSLADFLAYGYVPFDRSLFAGIRKLPPAHRLVYDAASGRADVAPFWKLERADVRDDPDELRERLDRAVVSHLVSDVPVGAFLSGGLDSSTVVSRAARAGGPARFPTFTVAYRDGNLDDVRYAKVASEAFGTDHREELLDIGDLRTTLDRAAQVYDEPLYDSTALAVLELSRLARRTVKVALTGDGGDEIFGGYGWHETVMRYEAMRERIGFLDPVLSAAHRGIVEPLSGIPAASRAAGSARLLAGEFADRYFPVRGFFTAAEQRRVLGRAPEDHAWLFRKFDRPDLPLAQRLLYLDIHTYLPDNNLMLVDRSTMAVGLEARVPLLDRQLVEYAFSLPPERIVRPGATKIAFREAIAPWLPEPVMTRSKSGFSPPFKRWVGGEARRSAFRTLEAGDLAADGVIDPRGVRTLVESGTQRRHNKLWLLLNLEAWYRRWIRGRSSREAGGAGAPAAVSA